MVELPRARLAPQASFVCGWSYMSVYFVLQIKFCRDSSQHL